VRDHDIQHFILGQWRDGAAGRTLPILNPADGQTIGRVARAERSDLEDAVAAAQSGFLLWRNMTALERARIMRKAATLVRERADRHRAADDA